MIDDPKLKSGHQVTVCFVVKADVHSCVFYVLWKAENQQVLSLLESSVVPLRVKKSNKSELQCASCGDWCIQKSKR